MIASRTYQMLLHVLNLHRGEATFTRNNKMYIIQVHSHIVDTFEANVTPKNVTTAKALMKLEIMGYFPLATKINKWY